MCARTHSEQVRAQGHTGPRTFRREVSPGRHRSHSRDSAELSESDIPLLVHLLDAFTTRRRVVHSDDDDVPLVEAGGDLPGASRRLVLVGGVLVRLLTRCQTCLRQVRGWVFRPALRKPASSSAVRRLVLVQSHASSEVETTRGDEVEVAGPSGRCSRTASRTQKVSKGFPNRTWRRRLEPTAAVEPVAFESGPSQFDAAFASWTTLI